VPEGDTVATHALRIRENMLGEPVTRVAGTDPTVRREARRIVETTIDQVESVGKHLLIDFSCGFTLRVHLGMTGHWRFGPPTDLSADGPARAVLETHRWTARCFQAPTVELGRTPRVWDAVRTLGPDLLDEPPPIDDAVARARATDQTRSISEILLDQHTASGIGNVYRNEVLFEAGIHPEYPVGGLSDEQLRWLYQRSADQMRRNIGSGTRSTTGARRPGSEMFVYGRERRACRRCGGAILIGESANLGRVTYWCPACQPEV
jgi:endonuclease-8